MAPFKPLTLNARRRNVLSFDWLMLFSAGSVQVGYLGTAHTLEPDNTDKKTLTVLLCIELKHQPLYQKSFKLYAEADEKAPGPAE